MVWVEALLPFENGDLLSTIHQVGMVEKTVSKYLCPLINCYPLIIACRFYGLAYHGFLVIVGFPDILSNLYIGIYRARDIYQGSCAPTFCKIAYTYEATVCITTLTFLHVYIILFNINFRYISHLVGVEND